MTTATQAFTGQPMGSSIAGPQGTFGPGFPSPIGAEQIFGVGSQQGQFPYPPQLGQPQPWLAIAAQITPLVQQAILPYVVSTACQQVLQLLPPVVAQVAAQSGVLSQPYQQHPMPWQGQGFFAGRPY